MLISVDAPPRSRHGGPASRLVVLVLSLFAAVDILWMCDTTQTYHSQNILSRNLFDDTQSLVIYENDRFLQDTNATTCSKSCCQQYVVECPSSSAANPLSSVPTVVQYLLIVCLLMLSALFAGLTLGLLSLDITGLEIVMGGDDPITAGYASRIYPIRKRGNLLLCTLLSGNVAANALLSILMADKAGGLLGFLLSTISIVIFAEILPQALCSRYPLMIGSAAIPLVKVIICLFFPVAFPLSWVLDKALGKKLATTYSNAEMLKLLQIHVSENALDSETAVAMTGALKYKNVKVQDVMTPVEKCFMLSVDERLSFETVAKIFKTGFSRIPVYEVTRVRTSILKGTAC
jgi:metal transporter CNNM